MAREGVVKRAPEETTEEPVYCSWFAKCPNPATTVRAHPILGGVPICQRCDEKVGGIEEATRRG